jgi:hypothetical protein
MWGIGALMTGAAEPQDQMRPASLLLGLQRLEPGRNVGIETRLG